MHSVVGFCRYGVEEREIGRERKDEEGRRERERWRRGGEGGEEEEERRDGGREM